MKKESKIYCSKYLTTFLSKNYSPIHGYLSLLVCQFGSIANVFNIVVLSRKEMRSPTDVILTGLAFADLLVMCDYIPYAYHMFLTTSQSDVEKFSYNWTSFVLFHSLFSQVCHTISICLTLILAIWRYVAVVHPHRNRDWCRMRNTGCALILSYMLCPLLCVPLFLALNIENREEYIDATGKRIPKKYLENSTMTNCSKATLYYVQFNQWAINDGGFHRKLNFWIYSVVIKLLPCLILTVLSTRLIVALIDTKRRRMILTRSSIPLELISNGNTSTESPLKDQPKYSMNSSKLSEKERQTDRTTRMLLAVLLLFLLTEFPQGILGLLSAVLGDPFITQCYMPLGDLMDILALINSAINFILYCSMSRQFRKTFKTMFLPKSLNKWVPVTQTIVEGNGISTEVVQL